MRTLLQVAVTALAMVGCATRSTIQSRIAERRDSYANLAADDRAVIDKGDLRAGLSEDAVYIALGKPAQVLKGGGPNGETSTWLYEGVTTDSYHYWRPIFYPHSRGRGWMNPFLDTDYHFRSYVSSELQFRGGRLESWRSLPRPLGNSYFVPSGMGGFYGY